MSAYDLKMGTTLILEFNVESFINWGVEMKFAYTPSNDNGEGKLLCIN